MTKEQLYDGAIVIHTEKKKKYRIISHKARIKDSVKGWIDGVIYTPLYENEYECFGRELNSFLENFEWA